MQNSKKIIPQTGSGSAPPDLTTYLLAAHIRNTYSSGTLQVTSSSGLKVQPSAGSMDTVLSEFDICGSSQKDDAEAAKREFYRNTAVAIADTPNRGRAIVKSGFDDSIYLFTGICITKAALTLLRGEETYATKMGGGFLTSATLGQAYIGRRRNVGVRFEIVDDFS